MHSASYLAATAGPRALVRRVGPETSGNGARADHSNTNAGGRARAGSLQEDRVPPLISSGCSAAAFRCCVVDGPAGVILEAELTQTASAAAVAQIPLDDTAAAQRGRAYRARCRLPPPALAAGVATHPERAFARRDVLPFGFHAPSWIFSTPGRHTSLGLIERNDPDLCLVYIRRYLSHPNADRCRDPFAADWRRVAPSEGLLHTVTVLDVCAASEGAIRGVIASSPDANVASWVEVDYRLVAAPLAAVQLLPSLTRDRPVPAFRVGAAVLARRFGNPGLSSAVVVAVAADVTYTLKYDGDGATHADMWHGDLFPVSHAPKVETTSPTHDDASSTAMDGDSAATGAIVGLATASLHAHGSHPCPVAKCGVRDRVLIGYNGIVAATVVEAAADSRLRAVTDRGEVVVVGPDNVMAVRPAVPDAIGADPILSRLFSTLDTRCTGTVRWADVARTLMHLAGGELTGDAPLAAVEHSAWGGPFPRLAAVLECVPELRNILLHAPASRRLLAKAARREAELDAERAAVSGVDGSTYRHRGNATAAGASNALHSSSHRYVPRYLTYAPTAPEALIEKSRAPSASAGDTPGSGACGGGGNGVPLVPAPPLRAPSAGPESPQASVRRGSRRVSIAPLPLPSFMAPPAAATGVSGPLSSGRVSPSSVHAGIGASGATPRHLAGVTAAVAPVANAPPWTRRRSIALDSTVCATDLIGDADVMLGASGTLGYSFATTTAGGGFGEGAGIDASMTQSSSIEGGDPARAALRRALGQSYRELQAHTLKRAAGAHRTFEVVDPDQQLTFPHFAFVVCRLRALLAA